MQIRVVDSFFHLLEIRFVTLIQGQDQNQGQGQDHLLLQRAALPPFLVLALTLTLVLVLTLVRPFTSR